MPRGTVIPLAITEAGIDGIVMSGDRPGPEGTGWMDFIEYWEDIGLETGEEGYIDQLAWYDDQVRQDGYVIGFALFTAGGGSAWNRYDVNGMLPELTDYVIQSRQ